MKVVLIGAFDKREIPNGFAAYSLNLARALARQPGIHLLPIGEFYSLPGTLHSNPFGWFKYVTDECFETLERIRAFEPEIVHCIGTDPRVAWPIVAPGHVTILSVLGILSREVRFFPNELSPFAPLMSAFERLAVARADHVIALTPSIAGLLRPRPRHLAIIPAGVEDSFFNLNPNKHEPMRILYVGAISERKGIADLVHAFKAVSRRCPDAHLILVGPERSRIYRNQLERLISESGLRSRITFTGPISRTQLEAEYERCSVFVLPSHEESQGIALLEAMAAGNPVVSYDIPGVRDVVEDGISGTLVAPFDIKQLAEAILRPLVDTEFQKEMGALARQTASMYRWEEVGARVSQLYRSSCR